MFGGARHHDHYPHRHLHAAATPESAQEQEPQAEEKKGPVGNKLDSQALTTEVAIIGGGCGGLAVAANLRRRDPNLRITVIEPSDVHAYQPGWTLVGDGTWTNSMLERQTASYIPERVEWLRTKATGIDPDSNTVVLQDSRVLQYDVLVVAAGLKLDWEQIKGLRETLGKNGVTSNYAPGMAPYTWEVVQGLTRGQTAIFTQPPSPIKCAGAPQKAMYLSCDYWRREDILRDVNVQYFSAGKALFGIDSFVPPLMDYAVNRYGAELTFQSRLVEVDGVAKRAVFDVTRENGETERVERTYDMLHVVPPQIAPDFVRSSPLANDKGWVDVDKYTLQHPRYRNVFALGDIAGSPNAKTAAAIKRQAPVVTRNVLAVLREETPLHLAAYDGYGGCPVTVENGKVLLAEFVYGGKLQPTIPFLDPTVPSRLNWFIKTLVLPTLYWEVILRGREWFSKAPGMVSAAAGSGGAPADDDAADDDAAMVSDNAVPRS